MNLLKKNIIFSDVSKLKGVGKQLSKYLKNRKIEKVKDILLNLPYSETDRSKIINLNNLEIGKIQVIELNEAFAAQSLAVIKDLGIPKENFLIVSGILVYKTPISNVPKGLLLFNSVATSIIDENDRTFPT